MEISRVYLSSTALFVAASMDQRFSFSDEQKKVLAESYERGMNSASKRCIALIEECASSAGCSSEQVKVSLACACLCYRRGM